MAAQAERPSAASQGTGRRAPAAGPRNPGRPRPAALRLAAAAQGIEAAGLCVAAVFAAISTADGKSSQLASGVVLTVLAFATAAGLAAIAVGLAKARPWSRIPAVMTQLFVVIAGISPAGRAPARVGRARPGGSRRPAWPAC